MKTAQHNPERWTPVEDRQARKLFYIGSKKRLNNDQIIEAIQDTARHISTTRCPHPEYGIIYEVVHIHFCAS